MPKTSRPHIAVVGSINMDFVVASPVFPVPGQTVMGTSIAYLPGGKGANQAVAAARLGARVSMIGAVGGDPFGDTLLQVLQEESIDSRGVRKTNGHSGIASITVSDGENNIIVVPGANGELTPSDIEAQSELLADADIVLLQLEIPFDTVEAALRKAKQLGKKTILNPAPAGHFPLEWLKLADIVTPNQTELAALVGQSELARPSDMQEALQRLHELGAETVIVTLGAGGAALSTAEGTTFRVNGHRVEAVDTTGAGDTFHGALAYAWASGVSLQEAMQLAVDASALSVLRAGAQTGMPTMAEVEAWKGKVRETVTEAD